MKYVYAAQKPWSLSAFLARRAGLPGQWNIVTTPADLNQPEVLSGARYVFFPHWSNIVSDEFLAAHECVCFHMTAVPYGRGGSPLQNLITRGHKDTVISALRMTSELDGGPVYLTARLSLDGSAEQIYARAAATIVQMIENIVETEPTPIQQSGEIVQFKRRTPAESVLPPTSDLEAVYDHIRMLDARGYPHAFGVLGGLRLTFTNAELKDGRLTATTTFTLNRDAEYA